MQKSFMARPAEEYALWDRKVIVLIGQAVLKKLANTHKENKHIYTGCSAAGVGNLRSDSWN